MSPQDPLQFFLVYPVAKGSFAVYEHDGNFLLKPLVEVTVRFDVDLLEFKGNLLTNPQNNGPGDITQMTSLFCVQLDFEIHGGSGKILSYA